MAIERTLSILKPDAVENNHTGAMLAMMQKAGLKICAMRMTRLTDAQAKAFYAIHSERPFYGELVEFMTRGPVVVTWLEGENAVAKHRELMGATNPAEAADGTLRKLFAASIGENACHGSDSVENGKIETAFFFGSSESL